MARRLSLRQALQRNRSEVRSRHHDWDVADVMGVVNESDLDLTTDDDNDDDHRVGGVGGERLAALQTGSALRRAAMESITRLTGLIGLVPQPVAKVLRRVIRDLNVPEAGDSLPHHGRATRPEPGDGDAPGYFEGDGYTPRAWPGDPDDPDDDSPDWTSVTP